MQGITYNFFERTAMQETTQYEGKQIHVDLNSHCRVPDLGRHFTALLHSIDVNASCLILSVIDKHAAQPSLQEISKISLPLSCVGDVVVGGTQRAGDAGPLQDIRRFILSQKLMRSLDAGVVSSLRVAVALPVLRDACNAEQIEHRIKHLTSAAQLDPAAPGSSLDASWWQRCASDFLDTFEQAMLQCTNRFFNASVVLRGSGSDRLLLLKVASLLHSQHDSINNMFRDTAVDPDPHPALIYITPLHLAARTGNLTLCSVLLAAKTDVNPTVHIAEKPEIDCPEMEDYNGNPSRAFLDNWQNVGTASLGRDMHGSCLDARYTYQHADVTPLKLALTFKHDDVVQLLLAHGGEMCESDGNRDGAIFFDSTYICAERRVYKHLMYRRDPLSKVRVGSYNCGLDSVR